MLLSAALLACVPLAPAPAAAPQLRALRRLSRLGSKRKLAGRTDDLFRRLPDAPDRDLVLVGSDADGLRVFTRGGPPEGLSLDGLDDVAGGVRAAAGASAIDLDVVLEITQESLGLIADLVDVGMEVSLLGSDGEPLRLISDAPGGEGQTLVEVNAGVLAPLGTADELDELLDSLDGSFRAGDVALLAVVGSESGAPWRAWLREVEPAYASFELCVAGKAVDAAGRYSSSPLFVVGDLSDAAFAELGEAHDGGLIGLSIPAARDSHHGSLARGLANSIGAKTVGEVVAGFAQVSAPFVIHSEPGGEAWSARTPATGAAGIAVLARDVKGRAMRGPLPWVPITVVTIGLLGLPAVPLGGFFAWLLRYRPRRWVKVKHAVLGLAPFLPFGVNGAVGLVVVLFSYTASRVIGWVLVRVLRIRRENDEGQWATLVGFGGLGAMVLVLWIVRRFTVE